MSKNKSLMHNRQKQKATARASARRKAQKPEVKRKAPRTDIPTVVTPQRFPDAEMARWICQGVNCITSSYEQGVWNPLFPEIYDGQVPEPKQIAETILAKFPPEDPEWDTKGGKLAMAWTVQSRDIMYAYLQAAKQRVFRAYPDADPLVKIWEPAIPVVWEIFEEMRKRATVLGPDL